MEKLDLRKTLKRLYSPSAKAPEMVDVPEMPYLMVDGQGDPNTSQDFMDAMQALFTVGYTMKFMLKKRPENPLDFGVMAPEGLWWTEGEGFDYTHRDGWRWTLLMPLPDAVTEADFAAACEEVRRKKKDVPALGKLRYERWCEGPCAQIMHLGPYCDEPPTIERLHAFIAEQGHSLRGKHHEIYLSDPRRTAPEKMKTILRQPVA